MKAKNTIAATLATILLANTITPVAHAAKEP